MNYPSNFNSLKSVSILFSHIHLRGIYPWKFPTKNLSLYLWILQKTRCHRLFSFKDSTFYVLPDRYFGKYNKIQQCIFVSNHNQLATMECWLPTCSRGEEWDVKSSECTFGDKSTYAWRYFSVHPYLWWERLGPRNRP